MINLNLHSNISQKRQLFLTSLLNLFDFLWIGQFVNNNLKNYVGNDFITINNKDFSTSYIPETSISTFNMPDNEIYKTSDTDNFWFDEGGLINDVTVLDLISTDNERTFIKYVNDTPYNVYMIGLLKSDVVLTDEQKDLLSKYFWLWVFYFGGWNDNGAIKENRTF